MAKVLVVGSGAREHVISECLYKSPNVEKVYVLNRTEMDFNRFESVYLTKYTNDNIVEYCKKKGIDLVVIGPEQPIVNGLSDALLAEEINCFAPSLVASRLESSKIFAKEVMINCDVPTSEYQVFNNYQEACSFMKSVIVENYVIKYDGLAGGKGVYLPETIEECYEILENIFVKECFGKGGRVLIEKRLKGIEVSVMGFCNGSDIWLMPQAQDYKRQMDDNEGLNTGGMGSICPVDTLHPEQLGKLRLQMKNIVKNMKYKGVLYAGVMVGEDGYNILEFNCRFGDPEAQVILTLLDSDLYDIFIGCVNGSELNVKWRSGGYAVNVVSSHVSYPSGKSREPLDMNIGELDDDVSLYFGNVTNSYGVYYTTGGRVCSVVAYSNSSMYDATCKAYNNIHRIKYRGQFYRRDIGLDYSLSRYDVSRRIKIGILGSTKGSSVETLLSKFAQGKINASVEVVVSNRRKAPILDKANNNAVSYIYLPYSGMNRVEYDTKLVKLLRVYDLDVVLLVGYMRIATSVLIDEFRGRIFNIHPSLLPKYAGGMDIDVHRNVIENCEVLSGCTLHHVTEEVDGGNFVMQKQIFVDEFATPEILKNEVQNLEKRTIVEFIKLCINGEFNLWGGYKRSGVNIDEGNKFVEMIKKLPGSDDIGGFCSVASFGDETMIGFATDGVGTKLELAKQFNKFDTVGIDLVAMSVNDLITRGFYPVYFLDYLAVDKLDAKKHFEVMKGVYKGCEIAGCKLAGGETAEMRGVYTIGSFDLAGFAVGWMPVGDKVFPDFGNSEDNVIYGVASDGLHSNGFSLVRRACRYGGCSIDEIMKPTKIYTDILKFMKLYEKDVMGVAHITGGGLMENLSRVVSDKFECVIDWSSWEVPEVFKWVQQNCGVSDAEMRRTFNCGIGMAIVTRGVLEDKVVKEYGLVRIGQLVLTKHQ